MCGIILGYILKRFEEGKINFIRNIYSIKMNQRDLMKGEKRINFNLGIGTNVFDF